MSPKVPCLRLGMSQSAWVWLANSSANLAWILKFAPLLQIQLKSILAMPRANEQAIVKCQTKVNGKLAPPWGACTKIKNLNIK